MNYLKPWKPQIYVYMPYENLVPTNTFFFSKKKKKVSDTYIMHDPSNWEVRKLETKKQYQVLESSN